ncbi:MAG: hypothetical protein ABR616_18815 [Dermatophilaceae bacterium]|nr:hypothetical protein [Intrasporangiaceae bacterium]
MKIPREILEALVARAQRAMPNTNGEVRALLDAEQLLTEDLANQFPVEDGAGTEYVQPTLFDPAPYEASN